VFALLPSATGHVTMASYVASAKVASLCFLFLRLSAGSLGSDSSSLENMAPESGQVLLQTQSIKNRANDLAIRGWQPTSTSAPLTEDGYQQVFTTCCHREMYAFAERLLGDLGLELCNAGGLAGVVVWYTCERSPDTSRNLTSLTNDLLGGQPPAPCAFAAPVGNCPPMDPSCQLAPEEIEADFVKECSTVTTATTTSTTVAGTTTTPSTTTSTTLACFSEDFLKTANDSCLAAGLGDRYSFTQCRTQVCADCTTADPNCATDIASNFDITGSPRDECWPEWISYATSACFQELQNCKASDAWLKMCVEDVCAAFKSGYPQPLDTATSYCDNQLRVERSASNAGTPVSLVDESVSPEASGQEDCMFLAHDNHCVGPNDEVLVKTFKKDEAGSESDLSACKKICSLDDRCSAVEWYASGNIGGRKCFHILDTKNTVPAAKGSKAEKARKKQCLVKKCGSSLSCILKPAVEATDSHAKCVIPANMKQCREFAKNHSVSVENGTWGNDFPARCSHNTEAGKMKVWWNKDTGDGDSVDSSSIRLCCGDSLLPTTTTTTRAQRPLGSPREFKEPPLRPYPATPSAVAIQRPINPVTSTCHVFGDPHVRLFDAIKGAGKMTYDAFVGGNYWMVKSDAVWIQAHQTGRDLQFDSRLDQGLKNYAHVTKVAVGGPFLRGSTVMIEGIRDGAQVWWNDKIILEDKGRSQYDLQTSDGSVVIQRSDFESKRSAQPFQVLVGFPEQVNVTAIVHPRDEQTLATTLDLVITMQQITAMDGLCGNFNGEVGDDTPTKPGGVQDRFGGINNRVKDEQLLIPY